MSGTKPTISIGMPVYNGENHLVPALDSILAQSFSDFEVIISDNASTDGTAEVCRKYRARDARIRYYRNPRNFGAAKNHNQVFELSSGKYFKWASHDDMLAPDFLSRCVSVLEDDPSVVLCYAKMILIDDFNKTTAPLQETVASVASSSPSERFGGVILHDRLCADIYGVIRSDVLRRTSLIASYVGSDRTLRAQLALLGRFYEVPEHLFFLRDHAARSVRSMPAHHQRVAWFDPERTDQKVLPHWRILLEYWKTVERAPLTSRQHFRCWLYLAAWLGRYRNWARMAADVIIFIRPGAWRFLYELASVHDKDVRSVRERTAQPGNEEAGNRGSQRDRISPARDRLGDDSRDCRD
jgi:glycosyltransferase involved in cell wall biosynthesis